MVAVNLMGGLGNQLCMYAYAMYLRKKYHYEVVLDSSWFDKYGFDNAFLEKREMLLHYFNVKIPIVSLSLSDKMKILPFGAKFLYVLNALAFRTFYKDLRLIENKNMPIERKVFDKNMLEILDHSYISGYFASYEYFRDLDLDLRFIGNLDNKNVEILEMIKSTKDSIGLHIRRGDYVNLHGYVKLGGAYYNSAITYMNKRLGGGNRVYFIFSNDVDFVKNEFIKHIKSDIKYHIIDIVDNNPAFEMYLMSCCKHQIIANSTFSFWAALLNENKDKIVITPDRFAYDRDEDIFPKEWIRINHLWGNCL